MVRILRRGWGWFLILAGFGEARSQQPLAATTLTQGATNESPARKQALAATRWIRNLRPTAVPSYLDLIVVEEQRDWVGVRFSWWMGDHSAAVGVMDHSTGCQKLEGQ
jgi:hypothetical protein